MHLAQRKSLQSTQRAIAEPLLNALQDVQLMGTSLESSFRSMECFSFSLVMKKLLRSDPTPPGGNGNDSLQVGQDITSANFDGSFLAALSAHLVKHMRQNVCKQGSAFGLSMTA